jgi:anti-sigma factor RsiW
MKCEHAHDLILESLDGSLPDADRTALDAHLSSCPDCVRVLKECVVTSQLLRSWDDADAKDLAPALPESLVRSILAARAADEKGQDRRRTTG